MRAADEAAFVKAYGPAGDWVRLFEQAPGFVRTSLWQDVAVPRRYVTEDLWQSRDSYRQFREQCGQAYADLDVRCAPWTESEMLIGEFEGVMQS